MRPIDPRSDPILETAGHARSLATPREVRHALVYVLNNMKGHQSRRTGRPDPCSSGAWFAGWRDWSGPPPSPRGCPLVAAKTWLLGAGWKRHGLLDVDERPA